jgi:hypothetical protein
VFIIANWKRALGKVFFSRYPHLSFISLIHNPRILRSVFLYPPQQSCRGVYWFHHVRPSVDKSYVVR